MTQEEKQILLKDLCSRLFYGVRAIFCDGVKEEIDDVWDIDMFSGAINADYIIDDVKPYLRPMSSMTEEEEQYVLNTWGEEDFNNGIDLMYDNYMMLGYAPDFIDWLNAHHFDYRGLIKKSLAIVAPEGMYKTE